LVGEVDSAALQVVQTVDDLVGDRYTFSRHGSVLGRHGRRRSFRTHHYRGGGTVVGFADNSVCIEM
jgi:hypothetical protein